MIKISIDRQTYSDACVSKTVYALSENYTISRKTEGETETISIAPKPWADKDEDVSALVWDKLNDYKLRDIIERETHDIRTILYAKAFGDFDVSECDI